MHKGVIRHQILDVRNEDHYWLPWDESMELAKKEEPKKEKAKKPVYVSISRLSSLCSVTKSGVHVMITITSRCRSTSI